jgi:hypothetical protein
LRGQQERNGKPNQSQTVHFCSLFQVV